MVCEGRQAGGRAGEVARCGQVSGGAGKVNGKKEEERDEKEGRWDPGTQR